MRERTSSPTVETDWQEVGSHGPRGNPDGKDGLGVLLWWQRPGEKEPFWCKVGSDAAWASETPGLRWNPHSAFPAVAS